VTSVVPFHVDVGTICGADYAGEVVKIGARQEPNFSLKVGDRVAGIVHGGERRTFSKFRPLYTPRFLSRGAGVHKDQGAFAEYVKADAAITWRIPDSISYEEAVTVSVGVLTCIQAMFHPKRLGLTQYPNQVPDQPWVSPPLRVPFPEWKVLECA
jgi:NADPH:quinone reductase-like Zn-dependent oxidoreductase